MSIPGIKEDYLSLFRSCILDQNRVYPPPEPIINLIQDGETIPFMTKKSFTLWQGKQKSKKTTALAISVSCMLRKESCSDLVYFESPESGVVLFIDCEQGESYAARTMHLILKLANLESSEQLIYCDLREFSPLDRIEIIAAAIENTPNIKLVVIDGLVDLMVDFMDAKEGHKVISWILALCSKYDIHVAGVLHQNKGQSQDARAHIGSIAAQKCEREVMTVVDPLDRAKSVISCKDSRPFPFKDYAIRWDKGELPKIVQDYTSEISEPQSKKQIILPGKIDKITHLDILAKVFLVEKYPKYQELMLGLKNQINSWYGFNIPDARVREYIRYYLDNQLIFKTGKTPHTRYQMEKPE